MRRLGTMHILRLSLLIVTIAAAHCAADCTAYDVFAAMAQDHKWLVEAGVSSLTLVEAHHENLALFVFGEPDDFGGEPRAVALTIQGPDGQRILDISGLIDERYTWFEAENVWLAGKPVIVLTAWYWTRHFSPTVHIINEAGVLFSASGGDFAVDSGKVVNFAFSPVWGEHGALPFIIDDDLDPNYRNFQSAYLLAPHIREVYLFDAAVGEFILAQETPVTQYAVIGAFLEAAQAKDFDAALQYVSDNWRVSKNLECGEALRELLRANTPDLADSKVARFVGRTDYSIRFQMQSGSVYDALFDRPADECYMSWRVCSKSVGRNLDCDPPRIMTIRQVRPTTSGGV